jgi:hypothetical protein
MDVLLVGDVLLVEAVDMDRLLAVGGAQQLQEIGLELAAVLGNPEARVLTDHLHGAHVALAQRMLLEGILVAHLALAHLAVPAQALQAFLDVGLVTKTKPMIKRRDNSQLTSFICLLAYLTVPGSARGILAVLVVIERISRAKRYKDDASRDTKLYYII